MRLTGTIDYFVRTTKDMILRTPIPLYVGMGRANTNAGSMRNKGLEVTLRWNDKIGKKTFSYSISANASFVKNKVLSLGSPGPIYGGGVARKAENFTRTEVGRKWPISMVIRPTVFSRTGMKSTITRPPDGQLIQPNAAPGDVKISEDSQ